MLFFFLTMTTPSVPQQLPSRLLSIALIWALVLIGSVIYTLFLSWRLQTSATMLHDARLIQAELVEMQQAVNQPSIFSHNRILSGVWVVDELLGTISVGDNEAILIQSQDAEINRIFENIEFRWRRNLKPMLLNATSADGLKGEFIVEVKHFTHDMNTWLTLIENDSSRNTRWLRLTQIAVGALSILSIIIVMWFLIVSVLRPLNQLQIGLERLRASDWKTKVHADGTLEFSHISSDFNLLADHLNDVYSNLENKVQEKTQTLAKQNTHLTTLYGLTAFLSEPHTIEDITESFLMRVLSLSKAQAGAVYLWDSKRLSFDCVQSKGVAILDGDSALLKQIGNEAISQTYPVRLTLRQEDAKALDCSYHEVTVYHIRNKQKEIGVFMVFYQDRCIEDASIDTLFETLGRHLGAAVSNLRMTALEQQAAVNEERNLMAQNLHDSIAQTLSFLNLQVQMLEQALQENKAELVGSGLEQIKAGVQECYEDVRELLVNFRTRVTQDSFEEIAQSVLKRFERQTQVKAHWKMMGTSPVLSSQEKLQAIFILQEALSNVRKHAQAKNVLVTLNTHHGFTLTIMDDGIGIDEDVLEARKLYHVGLSIMRERADSVAGHVVIESELDAGTTVRFILPKKVEK